MGLIQHDAIIVSSWKDEHIEAAHRKAIQLCCGCEDYGVELRLPVTEIVKSRCNGYGHFLIAPDGSKEGWTTSNLGIVLRSRFLEWAKLSELYLDVVTVNYGELNNDGGPVTAIKEM